MSTMEKVDWNQYGLPGRPVTGNGPFRTQVDNLADLLRDPKNAPVLVKHAVGAVREMLDKRYDRNFEIVSFITDEAEYQRYQTTRVPTKIKYSADVYGLLRTGGRPLSIPEREAAAATAWLVDRYLFSVNRGEHYLLPKLFNEAMQNSADRTFGIPWKALTEEKAFQLAAVIERRCETTTRVIEGDGGFYVVVDANAEFESEATLVRLQDIIWLLDDFDIIASANMQAMRDGSRDCWSR